MSFFRRLKMPPVPKIAGLKFGEVAWAIEDYLRKVRDALSAYDPDISPVVIGESSDGTVSLGSSATVAIDNSDPSTVLPYVVAGSINTEHLTDAGVTYAKVQDVSAASRLLGRGSASGSGDVQEIALGAGLTMSGTTLSAVSLADVESAARRWSWMFGGGGL